MRKKTKTKIRSLFYASAFFLLFALFSFQKSFPFPLITAQAAVYKAEKWQTLLSSFTTYFSQNDKGRCENIQLATMRIDGVILQPYGEFSFNQTVGKRTKNEGFFPAKVILNGEYVMGIGGGVCQVSTTLINALIHVFHFLYRSNPRFSRLPLSKRLQIGNLLPHLLAICIFRNFFKFVVFSKSAELLHSAAKRSRGKL